MKKLIALLTIAQFWPQSNAFAQTYTIATVAGGVPSPDTGFLLTPAAIGDGGPATKAFLNEPLGVALDGSGILYISDSGDSLIRKVSGSGIISTVVGSFNFGYGYSGDGGPALGAQINNPAGLAVDSAGNIYISDALNHRIRKVANDGTITTVAGGGSIGNLGDGGPATVASLNYPQGVATDASGNLYIADYLGFRIRKVSTSGTITTFAGTGYPISLTGSGIGDGGPATMAAIVPYAVASDAAGNVYIADWQYNRIRKVSTNGIISTVAGNGAGSYSGDGGPATQAGVYQPEGVAVDASGNIYISDSGNHRVRMVNAGGTISTIAGTGALGSTGDGGPGTSATLDTPEAIVVSPSGTIYFADSALASHGVSTEWRVRSLSTASPSAAITAGGIVPVYSNVATVQPGEWVSIYGTNLATSTVTWSGNFPTSLGGTSVTVDGKPAYLWFVSPTQINLQVPNDSNLGSVPVAVTTSNSSSTSTVTLAPFAPSFSLLDSKHVTGIILRSNGSGAYGGGTYDIIGPTGSSLGYSTVAAKAGDSVVLFGVGFGPTNPVVTPGQAYSGAAPTTNTVSLTINNAVVNPTFSGISSAGLYQINLTVPSGLGTGDVSLKAAVGGSGTQSGVVISLQ